MDTSFAFRTGAVLLMALFASSAFGQRMESFVLPATGSTWVYEVKSSGSYGTASIDLPTGLVEQIIDGQKQLAQPVPEAVIVTEPVTGAWFGLADRDGKMIISWDPPLSYRYPLEVGKTWTNQHQMKIHSQGQTVPYGITLTVEALEDLALPAGTIKAYRVRAVDTAGNVNVDWLSPDLNIFVKRSLERTDKHAQGPGRREFVLKSHELRKP